MDYRLNERAIKIADGVLNLLTGETKIHVQTPFSDNDALIGVVDKDFEVE